MRARNASLGGFRIGTLVKLEYRHVKRDLQKMAALGVDRDYIEYMMVHTISTYHDIKMKRIEFLYKLKESIK
jgi:hypothetical protein